MLATFRSRAFLALTAFSLAACGEETKFLTELSPEEATADIELTQVAFETDQTLALLDLSGSIDQALLELGGAPALSAVVAAGPMPAPQRFSRLMESVDEVTVAPMATIPAAAVGKTYEWNALAGSYEQTARTGAPANGVRFVLYRVDSTTFLPVEPLEEVGFADITSEGTASNPAARLTVKTTGGTTVFEYLARVGGTQSVPSFNVQGTAGTGPNAATFSLTVGVNLVSQNITADWRTAIPARGLTTRTTLGIGEETFTINGVMQRGLRKVSIGGTLNFFTGGQLTVKVGDATFARITTDDEFNTVITNAEGQPLTAEEEATLDLIFQWFASSLSWSQALLNPVYVVLGVE